MTSAFDRSIVELGDGELITLDSGEKIFKLDSYEGNPVVKPQDIGLVWQEDGALRIGAVFNGGAELFEGKVVITPRCHRNYQRIKYFDEKRGVERYRMDNYISEIWPLISEDGVHFSRLHDIAIRGDGTDHTDFLYGIEDIRIIKYSKTYLLVGCGKIKPPFKGGNADRIAIYSTTDFQDITYHGTVQGYDSRNAVPFSEHIDGKLFMLFRFHPNIHLDSLEMGMDQLLNPSKHEDAWKRIYERRSQNLLLEAGLYPHESEKIGPSTQLIKTDRGWLLIYHAVGKIKQEIAGIYGLRKGTERGYSVCAALLDLENPRKVLRRSQTPIYIPSAPYEMQGNKDYPIDVPEVVFPVGALVQGGRLLLYAGAGDKYIVLLGCSLNHLTNYLWENCKL